MTLSPGRDGGAASPAMEFAQIRADLSNKIFRHAISQQPNAWSTAPSFVFTERKNDVTSLFAFAEAVRGGIASGPGSDQFEIARDLRRRLYLKRGEEQWSRARILAILLILAVEPGSSTWTMFIKSLHNQEMSSSFSDSELPFTREKIEHILGRTGDHASHFKEVQWQFLAPSTSSFQEQLKHLRSFLGERLVTCKVSDDGSDETVPSQNPCETFLPEDQIPLFFGENKRQIKMLYVESQKSLVETNKPSRRHRIARQAEVDSELFLQQVQKAPKVLATLVFINITPTSKIWQSFTKRCLQLGEDAFKDFKLPCDHTTLCTYLECESWECASFQHNQHAFCAIDIKLGERNLINKRKYGPSFRLPLTEKRWLGDGAFGRVYSVRIKAPSCTGNEPVAMKAIKLRDGEADPNEWKKLEMLRDQNAEHKRIFKALAAVRTSNMMLIFFELADCDLWKYMREKLPGGPKDRQGRLDFLYRMADIADALMHLHGALKRDDHTRIVVYHMDIKADNILVKLNANGRLYLYLTDLGIASIVQKAHGKEESLYTGTGWYVNKVRQTLRAKETVNKLGHHCENIAPEAKDDGRVNASTDIWGYGTVFADLIPWLLDGAGASGLEGFRKMREEPSDESQNDGDDQTFFKIIIEEGVSKPILKTGVVIWYDQRVKAAREAREDEKAWICENYWRLIKDGMLQCDASKRWPIEKIYGKLCDLSNKLRTLEFGPNRRAAPHDVTETLPEMQRSQWHTPTTPGRTRHTPSITHSHRDSMVSQTGTTFSKLQTSSELDDDEVPPPTSSLGLGISINKAEPVAAAAAEMPILPAESLAQIWHAISCSQDVNASNLVRNLAGSYQLPRTEGSKLLHVAASRGLAHTTGQLLAPEVGVDIESRDTHGCTALLNAIGNGHESLAETLMEEHGSKVDVRDAKGKTPLHLAIAGNLPADFVSKLISRWPALIGKQDAKGHTPLHTCVIVAGKYGSDIARLLLAKRADSSIRDKKGRTPLQLLQKEVESPVDLVLMKKALASGNRSH